jgi:hypothetical protein
VTKTPEQISPAEWISSAEVTALTAVQTSVRLARLMEVLSINGLIDDSQADWIRKDER